MVTNYDTCFVGHLEIHVSLVIPNYRLALHDDKVDFSCLAT